MLPSALTCFLRNCLGQVSGLLIEIVVSSAGMLLSAVDVAGMVILTELPVASGLDLQPAKKITAITASIIIAFFMLTNYSHGLIKILEKFIYNLISLYSEKDG